MRTLIIALIVSMLVTAPAAAQAVDTATVWRTFAERVEVGAAIKVRLRNGRSFTATLVAAQPDALLVQPRTRAAVPVQPIAYDAIVSIERHSSRGMSAAKAAAVGIASGAGTVLAVLFILFANLD